MSLRSRYTPYVIHRTSSSGGYSPTPVESTVGGFQGFIQPISGGESFDHLQLTDKVTFRLYTDTLAPLKAGDDVSQNGETYKVLWAFQPSGISGTSHHKEVLLGLRG